MKTYMIKNNEVKRGIFFADADNKILGRLATKIASILAGKHKPVYTPHVDTGDYVIVVNADKVRVTGNKLNDKSYKRYSGYPGGLKEMNLGTLLQRKPTEPVRQAVRKMLPKSKLGKRMLKKLKLYAASEKPVLPKNAKEITI